jgi:hypothetical protein
VEAGVCDAKGGRYLALVVCHDAIEFGCEGALDGFRAPLSASDAAHIGAVHLQLARHAAVQPAQRLHISIQERDFSDRIVFFRHNRVRCLRAAVTLFLAGPSDRDSAACPDERVIMAPAMTTSIAG